MYHIVIHVNLFQENNVCNIHDSTHLTNSSRKKYLASHVQYNKLYDMLNMFGFICYLFNFHLILRLDLFAIYLISSILLYSKNLCGSLIFLYKTSEIVASVIHSRLAVWAKHQHSILLQIHKLSQNIILQSLRKPQNKMTDK